MRAGVAKPHETGSGYTSSHRRFLRAPRQHMLTRALIVSRAFRKSGARSCIAISCLRHPYFGWMPMLAAQQADYHAGLEVAL